MIFLIGNQNSEGVRSGQRGQPTTSGLAQRRQYPACKGSANLKGSAGLPPLRQAAIPLAAMQDDSVVERVPYREYNVQTDRAADKLAASAEILFDSEE